MTETTLTPSRLWKRMTAEQRLAAARAFWRDEQAAADHAQAVVYIAQQKKFRPRTVMSLDEGRKVRHLASLPTLPDALAARALVVYHVAAQRPMMSAFLDAVGIAHEEGLIEDDTIAPDPAKVGPAAAQLAKRFPAADVSLYLNTLLYQDPEAWGALRAVPELQT